MDCLLFVTILSVAFVAIQCAYGADSKVPVVGNTTANESNQIIQGNCSTALAADEVFRDHVRKLALPFIKRNATSSWHGDQTIYCLEVLNSDGWDYSSTAGTAFVKEGGVNHSFVTVEMHSKSSHSMEFDIIVYAR